MCSEFNSYRASTRNTKNMSEENLKIKRRKLDNENIIKNYGYRLRRAIRFNESPNNILKIMNISPISIQQLDRKGEYPLHIAFRYLNDNIYNDVILQLMELFPIALQQPNKDQHDLPLHIACSRSNEALGKNIILKLMELCPMAIRQQNKKSEYPLDIALRLKKSEDVVFKLIELFPEASNNQNYRTRNDILSYYGDTLPEAILQILTQTPDNDGFYPIHDACREERHSWDRRDTTLTVRTIMKLDPLALQRKTPEGFTPLHLACNFALADVVEMFMKNHLDEFNVNACDEDNDTPFHMIFPNRDPFDHREFFLARERIFDKDEERLRIVQILLDHPFIDINHKNDLNDQTPLDRIKNIIKELEEDDAYDYDHRFDNEDFDGEWEYDGNPTLQVCLKIRKLIGDFQVKRRWNAFCYHLNDDVMDL